MANARWRALARSKERRRRNKDDRRDSSQMPPAEPGSDAEAPGVETAPAVSNLQVQPATQHPFAGLSELLDIEDEVAS